MSEELYSIEDNRKKEEVLKTPKLGCWNYFPNSKTDEQERKGQGKLNIFCFDFQTNACWVASIFRQ